MRQKTLSLLLLSLLLPVSLSAQTFRPRIMSGLRLTMLPGQTQDPMQLINSSGTVLALLNNAGRFEVAVLTNAGACTDAVFTFTPVDGTLCVDTTADELYFRTSGAWFSINPAGGGGITTLNGLAAASQSFAIGTAGTDFAVSSAGSVHTFDLPSASATARGVVTTAAQTFGGTKTTPTWNATTGFQVGGAALNFSHLSGSAIDAQVPNTITLDNITQITTRPISSTTGDLAASRVDDGGAASTQSLFSVVGNLTLEFRKNIHLGFENRIRMVICRGKSLETGVVPSCNLRDVG